MEKLELKHILPYIPYDLMALRGYDKKILEVTLQNRSNDPTAIDIFNVAFHSVAKPLLIPLSQYWSYHDKMQGTIHAIIYNETKLSVDIDLDIEIECAPSDTYLSLLKANDVLNILFQHHFDVFGLIDKGLALNKLDYFITPYP